MANSIKIKISDSVLEWIIKNIDTMNVSEKILEKLYEWQKGEKTPTFRQIEDISKSTGIPFGYFFLDEAPQEDISFMNYRTINSAENSKPSRNLIDTMHDMEMIQDWVRSTLIADGAEPIDFIKSKSENDNVEEIAVFIRNKLNLPLNWYTNFSNISEAFREIRNAISSCGVIVMLNYCVGNNTRRLLDINEFRAFSIIDEYAPLIFINSRDATAGRLFSLLHEFTHICLGINSIYNYHNLKISDNLIEVNPIEILCNAAAAEVLMPKKEFLKEWYKLNTNDKNLKIEKLASIFKCSELSVARRALDNAFISNSLYNEISKKIYNKIKDKAPGGPTFNDLLKYRTDKKFLKMLIESVHEGKTSYTEAFRLTYTSQQTFDNIVENLK